MIADAELLELLADTDRTTPDLISERDGLIGHLSLSPEGPQSIDRELRALRIQSIDAELSERRHLIDPSASRARQPAPHLTSDQLLALQSLAISEGNVALKIQTWIAQGRDPRYGYCEVLEGEQRTAMAGCVDAYEMASLVGCAL